MKTNRRAVVALLFCSLLSSCFTMAVWGVYPHEEHDPKTGYDDTVYGYDPKTAWSWGKVGLRVLLTPLSLVLDCVTAPVQAFLWAAVDDDANCNR